MPIHLAALAAVAVQQAIAPPVIAVDGPMQVSLVTFAPGVVRCGEQLVEPTFIADPLVEQVYAAEGRMLPQMTIRFAIDANGRPISIGQPERSPGAIGFVRGDDLAPALAAWRFADRAARTDCRITFTPTATPVATAPFALVSRAFATPMRAGRPKLHWHVA